LVNAFSLRSVSFNWPPLWWFINKHNAFLWFNNVCIFSGLVKELDTHKFENANKHLDSHATYVLVSKEIQREDSLDARATPLPPQFNYKPLLDRYEDIFPNFAIRSAEVQKTGKRLRMGKSPSPAGRYSTSRNTGKKTPTGKVTARRK